MSRDYALGIGAFGVVVAFLLGTGALAAGLAIAAAAAAAAALAGAAPAAPALQPVRVRSRRTR